MNNWCLVGRSLNRMASLIIGGDRLSCTKPRFLRSRRANVLSGWKKRNPTFTEVCLRARPVRGDRRRVRTGSTPMTDEQARFGAA